MPTQMKRKGAQGGAKEKDAPHAAIVKPAEAELIPPLSPEEKQLRERCEATIRKGLEKAVEAAEDIGAALQAISEKKLYRETHAKWDDYLEETFKIGRAYASRLIGFSERVKLLPENNRPANEWQARPLLKLAPADVPKAWEKAVKEAKDGVVTSDNLAAVVAEMTPAKKKPRKSKAKASKQSESDLIRRVLSLVRKAQKAIDQKDELAQLLANIEKALAGATD